MIDFESALQIAKGYIGNECDLVDSATCEKSYGWYFYAQSKKFLKSGLDSDLLCGSAGFLVEREAGRIVAFGSAYSANTWLANYEKGFKYECYDLMINAIYDEATTLQALFKLDMQYVIPEWMHGTEWRVPRRYSMKELAQQISELPCRFEGQSFCYRVEVFDWMNETKCCEYSLIEHVTC
jgi:hypothetical protein